MNLRELFEARNHGAAIIFGRFNPPHFGHSNAWDKASKFPIWYVGTNQSTQGPKDPLPFEVKVEAMKTIMPGIEGHLVAEQSWWTLATMVYKKHGGNMILHVVTDPTDKEIFVPGLKGSNGVEGPHGYYKFIDVVWEPATRDSTATALRAAVEHDNPKAFSKAAGIDADTMIAGKPFFELVKHYMTPYLHAAAEKERLKAEKERLKAEKEAAKANKNKVIAEKSTSEKQARFMAAAAHDPAFAARTGIKQSVAKEFNKADTGTKQLSNAMKHKKKTEDSSDNLIKETNQKIRERKRAVAEGAKAHGSFIGIGADVDAALPGVWLQRQLRNTDPYMQYRYGLALAAARADAAGHVDFEQESGWAENLTIVGFTPEDAEVVKMADKLMGVHGTRVADDKSREAKGTSTQSVVAKPKRNKYGI